MSALAPDQQLTPARRTSTQPPVPGSGAMLEPQRPILDCTPPDPIKGSNRTMSASQMRPEATGLPVGSADLIDTVGLWQGGAGG